MRETPKLFASGFAWPEAPRWHQGALWISDAHNFRIAKVEEDVTSVLQVPDRPAGMDFATDGSLLFATALKPRLYRFDGSVRPLADLSGLLRGNLNDLITARSGWSWVGDTGFAFGVDTPVNRGRILAFHHDHGARIVADNVFFPNGLVLDPVETTLYACETFGQCISTFDIGPDGALTNRRLHASLPGRPDGLCLDAEGCLWVPLLFEGIFLRIAPDGSLVDQIDFPGRRAISCVIGGAGRDQLFLCTAKVDDSDPKAIRREGTVHVVSVAARGAGRP